ncbi:MAG: polyribonucleotide nucleotidyltransferase [Acidobacteria bacterium]|nr:polyribonucleotide nucleotidyltransferase [Acidobacteriota bacterium]
MYRKSMNLGGREFSIEMGKMAKQANGAALVRYGETVVLVTACAEMQAREGIDFFPLTVDYREYNYAAGRIPGGFFKREGRPTEKEIITSRQIDRPLRPLFPEGFRCETQVIALVLSADVENDPDVVGMTGASAALFCSDIPFFTPIAGVRVGLVEDALVINPTNSQLKQSRLSLVVAGSEEAIMMVEARAKEVSEEVIVDALRFAHDHIRQIVQLERELFQEIGIRKREVIPKRVNAEFYRELEAQVSPSLREAIYAPGKQASYSRMDQLKSELVESFPAEDLEKRLEAGHLFEQIKEKLFREGILSENRRPDGREFHAIRTITTEVGFLPRTHGSALFTRGETQALVTATLGTGEDVQRLDTYEGDAFKRFMLHYNFPPFSVGEVAFLRGPGRREIGHGALAERAIASVIPDENDFPYTIRVVSDILESNGSSSMATVCGGILALMDAGVPIKGPVAGVAMGLVKEKGRYAILSDIAGLEDHYGDMDFKVAGTARGITALQMDIKISGITPEIMYEALQQAKEGRLYILEKMLETISAPRPEISPYAPRIYTIQIPVEKIGAVIGPGGKVIRGITERTGVKIDIEDDGRIFIAAQDEVAAQKAIQEVRMLTAEAELGKTYLGKVVRIADFGAFVEIFPGTEGLLHISEVAERRIRSIRDELTEGQEVLVKVINIDAQNRIRLSHKSVLREQRGEKDEPRPEPRPHRERERRGHRRY